MIKKILVTLCLASCLLPQARGQAFDINVSFPDATLSASQQAIFTTAEATWEALINGYQAGIDLTGFTGQNGPTITATAPFIDGAGGILGSAGPDAGLNFGPGLVVTTTGSMSFDSADVAALETAGTLLDVILHEMGHVLGIGTWWQANGVYVNGSGQYTGANGLTAYNEEYGLSAAFVPVELGGGGGTANGHWDEVDNGAGLTGRNRVSDGQDMRNELMTGWLNAPSFIGDLTVASLEDIGFDTVWEASMAAVPEAQTALPIFVLGLIASLRRLKKAKAA